MTQNTTLSERLEPCPFCGGAAKLIKDTYGCHLPDEYPEGGRSWVVCPHLGCKSGHKFNTASQAVSAWNRRAPIAPAEPVATDDPLLVSYELLKDREGELISIGMQLEAALRVAREYVRDASALRQKASDDLKTIDEALRKKPHATPAQPSTVTAIKDKDIPALLKAAIVRLERYDAPSRPAMLDLASHLRGVLEIPHEAEEAVRRCASIDSNGYIAEKSAVIAALRAGAINTPPAPSPVTPSRIEMEAEVYREMHALATKTLGYECILTALEDLARLKEAASPVTGALEDGGSTADPQRWVTMDRQGMIETFRGWADVLMVIHDSKVTTTAQSERDKAFWRADALYEAAAEIEEGAFDPVRPVAAQKAEG
ncbi:Lar family restriction alleviation protein [Caulobacter hibisci]|uniref:Lar family restriction alleviation protein n=1 Tax=Caulobacter hibisci TaxID=2035993 RepID=A0ABS0SRZ1_9CAUL|nr:Lar family restriction alleviation protein [Caulobacter hibisci]MBI1682328.1 Lar family restriction alleviation protein [Caulobacter hibisci]